jgi:hypothetical protein
LPAAPTLTISKSGGIASLSWNSIPNADGYLLGYAPSPDASPIGVLDMGNRTNFSFGFLGSAAYYVVVLAYNVNGWGPLSNIGSFIVP